MPSRHAASRNAGGGGACDNASMHPLPTPLTAATSRSGYRPEIDGLRALAVGAVIVNHFDKSALPGGYLGVDVFFVISGYVITGLLARSRSASFGDLLGEFYQRRIRRLVPALVLCVACTALALCLFNPEPAGMLDVGMKALFGFSNIALYRQSIDYFGASTELNGYTQTWSLGVEEQFYLIFPALVWFSGFGRQAAGGQRRLFLVVLALSLASLACFAVQQRSNQPAAYFLMHARFWELGAGCLLFLSCPDDRTAGWLGRLAPWLSLAGLLGVMCLPFRFSVSATVGAVLLTALLIATLRPGTAAHGLLTRRAVVYVGLISYSLYLWHWSVLAISRWTIGVHHWSVPLQVLAMLVLAAACHRYVEQPLRRAPWSPRPWRTVGYGAAASVVAAAMLLALGKPWLGERLYAGTAPELQQRFQAPHRGPTPSCNLFEAGAAATAISERCGSAGRPGAPTVYLLGDSHSFQFLGPVAEFARERGYGYRNVWGNSCLFPAAALQGPDSRCYRLQQQVEAALLARVRPGDLVVIANALYARFSGQWNPVHSERRAALAADAQDYSAALVRLSNRLVAQGARVVLYLDGAQFPGLRASERCDEQWFAPFPVAECFIGHDNYRERRDRLFGWVFGWADGRTRFAWDGLDQTSCADGLCRARHYADSNHFKDYYADFIFRKFLALHPALTAPSPPGTAVASQGMEVPARLSR